MFTKGNHALEVGYHYFQYNVLNKRIYVILYDSSKKRHMNTEEGRSWIEKEDPQKNWGVCQYIDILEGVALIGKNYQKQIDQVKAVVIAYLQK